MGTDTYYIFHLTYSAHNSDGFPKYEEFPDIYAMKKFSELTHRKRQQAKPPKLEPVSVIAFGWPDEEKELPPRRETAMVHYDRW